VDRGASTVHTFTHKWFVGFTYWEKIFYFYLPFQLVLIDRSPKINVWFLKL